MASLSVAGKRTFMVGVFCGVLVLLVAEKMDDIYTTDTFCTSCHTMKAYVADDETFLSSSHRTTSSGVVPGCADCHIPKGIIAATYTHIVNGVGDIWGELSNNYDDPGVWQEKRSGLAYAVRDWMRANDSVTCRSCHAEDKIKPARRRGKRQHESAKAEDMTCIDCHYNIVHKPVEPRESFLDGAG